jgi:hypothetical protein
MASTTAPARSSTSLQGEENAPAGQSSDKQPSGGKTAEAGMTSATEHALEQYGERNSRTEMVIEKQPLGGKTATQSVGSPSLTGTEIQDLMNPAPGDMSILTGITSDNDEIFPKGKEGNGLEGVGKEGKGKEGKGKGKGKGRRPSARMRNRDGKDKGTPIRMRPLCLEDVSRSLETVAPAIIDLTAEGNDDEAIEQEVARLDEDFKNQCLVVFFRYLSNRAEGGKVGVKRRKTNPFIDDEAFCDDRDASPDEEIDEDSSSGLEEFIDKQDEPESYDAAHVLVPMTGNPGKTIPLLYGLKQYPPPDNEEDVASLADSSDVVNDCEISTQSLDPFPDGNDDVDHVNDHETSGNEELFHQEHDCNLSLGNDQVQKRPPPKKRNKKRKARNSSEI